MRPKKVQVEESVDLSPLVQKKDLTQIYQSQKFSNHFTKNSRRNSIQYSKNQCQDILDCQIASCITSTKMSIRENQNNLANRCHPYTGHTESSLKKKLNRPKAVSTIINFHPITVKMDMSGNKGSSTDDKASKEEDGDVKMFSTSRCSSPTLSQWSAAQSYSITHPIGDFLTYKNK